MRRAGAFRIVNDGFLVVLTMGSDLPDLRPPTNLEAFMETIPLGYLRQAGS